MEIGSELKFRSDALKISRLFDCGVAEGHAFKIFEGQIGVVVESEYPPKDKANITIAYPFGVYVIPAHYFTKIIKRKKGHHLTSAFKD